jgi:cyclopropane fatty-acyl-phospholipid synthase-like methyltransferase
MKKAESQKEYWAAFWSSDARLNHEDPYYQVGHTVNGMPIDQERWQFTLVRIEEALQLDSEDTVLDLCAGNGLISEPISKKCKSVTAIDFSAALIGKINTRLHPNIVAIHADARDIELVEDTFSKAIMYGALQHFSEREAIAILEKLYLAIRPGGTILVGDIPDIDRLFCFYSKPEWVAAYFDSLKHNTPAVGTWFKKDVIAAMARYVGFKNIEVRDQHPRLLNSHYRFDLLLKK